MRQDSINDVTGCRLIRMCFTFQLYSLKNAHSTLVEDAVEAEEVEEVFDRWVTTARAQLWECVVLKKCERGIHFLETDADRSTK